MKQHHFLWGRTMSGRFWETGEKLSCSRCTELDERQRLQVSDGAGEWAMRERKQGGKRHRVREWYVCILSEQLRWDGVNSF